MEENSYKKLSKFGQELLTSTELEEGLPLIAKYANDIIGSARCSIFIYDNKKNILWTTLADGIEKIIIDYCDGIVGQSLKTKEIIIENSVDNNPSFLSIIDEDSGFKTKNIICSPIIGSHNEAIGVLELLNKEDGFTKEDEKFMKLFTGFISSFIELAPRTFKFK